MANCLAHGRRQFVDVADRFPEECRHVLEALAVVYHNDAVARKQNLSPQARLEFHQAHSGPTMEELRLWLVQQFDQRRVEPNSALGGAIAYLLKRWDKLTLFLRVPGAPLDNNLCERALKKARADCYCCLLLFDERCSDKIGNRCTSRAGAIASASSASISRRRAMSESIGRVPPRA